MMICPKCQKMMETDSDRCTSCGFQVVPSLKKNPADEGSTGETQVSPRLESKAAEVKITKVARNSIGSKSKPAKTDPEAAQTKVAQTRQAQQTKIYGQPQQPKEVLGWLVVIKGRQQWQQFVISKENCRYIIGNSTDADLRFDDEGVEPVHSSLRVDGGKIYLTDLDTSSGTFVNGEKILRNEIEDGVQINIGSMEIKFKKL